MTITFFKCIYYLQAEHPHTGLSSIGAVYEIPQSCHTDVVHSVECSIPGHPRVRNIEYFKVLISMRF